jgi:hypothetical protein
MVMAGIRLNIGKNFNVKLNRKADDFNDRTSGKQENSGGMGGGMGM